MAISVNDTPAISAMMTIKRIEAPRRLRITHPRDQSLFRTWFCLFVLGIVLCGFAGSVEGFRSQYNASGRYHEVGTSPGCAWKLVGSQEGLEGRELFVLVNKAAESDRKLYDDAIEHLCQADEWCGLHFWSDSSLIPNLLPMSDPQTAAEVANFTRSPSSGFGQFAWNCRVHNDPLNCFSYQ
jgi:hypothetical protein